MHLWLADPPFFGGPGQGARQIIELFVAFGLTSLIMLISAPAVLAGVDGVTGIRQLDDDPD